MRGIYARILLLLRSKFWYSELNTFVFLSAFFTRKRRTLSATLARSYSSLYLVSSSRHWVVTFICFGFADELGSRYSILTSVCLTWLCGVVWWCVVWCGGVWCGVVRCGVVWCGWVGNNYKVILYYIYFIDRNNVRIIGRSNIGRCFADHNPAVIFIGDIYTPLYSCHMYIYKNIYKGGCAV